MTESYLKLKEKTIILAGPPHSVLQSTAQTLIELGADVALITPSGFSYSRFAQNLMDMREGSDHYGRAACIEADISNADHARDAITKVAELFGSIDAYVDGFSLKQPNMAITNLMTDQIVPFLKGRNKGRIVFLIDQALSDKEQELKQLEVGVRKRLDTMALELFSQGVTVNALALKLTEERTLKISPQAKTIQAAFREINQTELPCRLMNGVDAANCVAFLVSPLSLALNGQMLNLTYGY